jgi:hypothetical protein
MKGWHTDRPRRQEGHMAKRATEPVQTREGRVRGRYDDKGPAVAVFRGIPLSIY